MQTLNTTPKADGFWMPGEFEPHAGCWMLWPERPDVWRNGGKPAQRAYAQVAMAIAEFEPVTMGVSATQYEHARHMLPESIRIVEISYDDAWLRDVGPTMVINAAGEVRGVDWQFNAWGGLHSGQYFPWDKDELVAQKLLEMERFDRYRAPLILEGGSIHVDGEGTLLVTEQCLLHPNRNPKLRQADIEAYLKDYLNVEVVIWLGEGVHNDETNGHVDNLCCFIRPGEVALTWTDDERDPQHEISMDAYQRLLAAVDAKGRKLAIHKIHQPDPMFITDKEARGIDIMPTSSLRNASKPLAGSYINFYIANGGIIAPQFNDHRDQKALETLRVLFPQHKIVGIPLARDILLGGGNIHCITQQIPLGKNS